MQTNLSEGYIVDIEKQRLTLENVVYTSNNIADLLKINTDKDTDFKADLYYFLTDWFSDSPTITVQTSGSTGTPKVLTVRKEQMIQSALLTCSFLNLSEGDSALLCMPLQYIAGKMMVVRALVAQLNLVICTPTGHPMADICIPFRFAAMIPLQVYNSLQIPQEAEKLKQIDILIIGGGAIDATLEEKIKELPNAIYSTYGMTETLSHIALRRLNGTDASPYYIPFPSVKLSLSEDNTLVINAPLVCDEQLVTNDVAEIYPNGSFSILGRKDNIINCGGIKIQTETVEDILRSVISSNFAITSVSHPKFGEIIVLLVEKPEENLEQIIKATLPKYQQPKLIRQVDTIPLTGSGKIDRAACKKQANAYYIKNTIV